MDTPDSPIRKPSSITAVVVLALMVTSCASVRPPPPAATGAPPQRTEPAALRGRVVDTSGQPVSGADVTGVSGKVLTDADGWFSLRAAGSAEWLTVRGAGFISRTRAAVPGSPVLFRLSPDDGQTVVIHFGGDTMFGRRFFDPNEDGNTSDGLLPTSPSLQDELRLLQPVQPLLANADLSVLNLEGPLADPAYLSPRDPRPAAYHSTKDYVFASASVTAAALRQSGVEVVDIGNNHLYDLLETGVQSTVSTMDQAGLLHFGAGANEAAAWAPVVVTVKGQSIAFLGCTTIPRPIPPASTHDVSYVASDALKKGGAARCETARLRDAVRQARKLAQVVVVMIHGGKEYNPSPTDIVARLTRAAQSAGATLVINHHPHVVGGFSWNGSSLVGWSMGNFLFDQTIWPTFPAEMLAVYVRDGEVVRAYVEPLMLEDFVPRGVAGGLADSVARAAAGLWPGPFVMEDGAMELELGTAAIRRSGTMDLKGGSDPGTVIPVPDHQWISDFQGSGTLRLGHDLLWVGGFEDPVVDRAGGLPPLWTFVPEGADAGANYAYEGSVGVRLIRGSSNRTEAVTTHLHRLLASPGTDLTVLGMLRASKDAGVRVQVSWYPDTKGSSSMQSIEPITVAVPDQWQAFRIDVTVPAGAVAAALFVRLAPPSAGIVTADFDNLRVVEWAPPLTAFSPLYGFGRLTGDGKVTFSQEVLPGAESWLTLP